MTEKRHAFRPAKNCRPNVSSPLVSPSRNAIGHEMQVVMQAIGDGILMRVLRLYLRQQMQYVMRCKWLCRQSRLCIGISGF